MLGALFIVVLLNNETDDKLLVLVCGVWIFDGPKNNKTLFYFLFYNNILSLHVYKM